MRAKLTYAQSNLVQLAMRVRNEQVARADAAFNEAIHPIRVEHGVANDTKITVVAEQDGLYITDEAPSQGDAVESPATPAVVGEGEEMSWEVVKAKIEAMDRAAGDPL